VEKTVGVLIEDAYCLFHSKLIKITPSIPSHSFPISVLDSATFPLSMVGLHVLDNIFIKVSRIISRLEIQFFPCGGQVKYTGAIVTYCKGYQAVFLCLKSFIESLD
jgi:hypothetical protein